jgi:hypothetical protein
MRLAIYQTIEEPATDTCFPESELWLRESCYHQEALKWVVTEEDPGDYLSVLDWLYVVLWPTQRQKVMDYYDGDGKRALDWLGWPVCLRIDKVLLRYLKALLEFHKREED